MLPGSTGLVLVGLWLGRLGLARPVSAGRFAAEVDEKCWYAAKS